MNMFQFAASLSAPAKLTIGSASVGAAKWGGLIGANAVLGAALSPVSRELAYQANAKAHDVVPDPETCLGLFYSGKILGSELSDLLLFHGIPYVSLEPGEKPTKKAWREAIELARPKLSPAEMLKFYRQGRLGGPANGPAARATLEQYLRELGFQKGPEKQLIIEDFENIDIGTIRLLFLMRAMSQDQAVAQLQRHGLRENDATLVVKSWSSPVSPAETLVMLNRGLLKLPETRAMLSWNGMSDVTIQDKYIQLARNVPGPSDLISFAVKEVWDQQVVDRFGYDAEFPPEFAAWMASHGLAWGEQKTGPEGQIVPALPWPKAYWRAHWNTPSPTACYDFLHRFRPLPGDPTQSVIPGVKPFTSADLSTILKIADYPAPFRQWLEAASYAVLRLIDIRNMFKFGVLTREQTIGKFQDRGQTRQDAEALVDLEVAKEEEKIRQAKLKEYDAATKKVRARVISSYRIGLVSRDDAYTHLVDTGIMPDAATLMLAEADLTLQQTLVSGVIARAKSDFMSGRASKQQVNDRLTLAELDPKAVQYYIGYWEIQRGEKRIHFSTVRILDIFKRGLITDTEARKRLTNLGWSDVDTLINIQAAQQDLQSNEIKRAEKIGQARIRQAKELQALVEKADAQRRKFQADLRRISPRHEIAKWLKDGLVSTAWWVKRMYAMGYPIAESDRYYKEITGEELTKEQKDQADDELQKEKGEGEEESSEGTGGATMP